MNRTSFFSHSAMIALILTGFQSFAQESTWYLGYSAGTFFKPQAACENYATRFNLGWQFDKTDDDALIFFNPGPKKFEVNRPMDWSRFNQGINFGVMAYLNLNVHMQLGFHQLHQSHSGVRTEIGAGNKEKFKMRFNSSAFEMNFIFSKNEIIMPVIGASIAGCNIRYSYDADTLAVQKAKLGYHIKLDMEMLPGAHELSVGFNFGCMVRLLDLDDYFIYLMPLYQQRFKFMGDLYRSPSYPEHQFLLGNASVSILLTKTLH